MALPTLPELRVHVQIDVADTSYDVKLQQYLDAAVPWVENIAGPVAQLQRTERHYPTTDTIVLRSKNVAAIVSVTEYIGGSSYVYTAAATPASGSQFSYSQDPSIPSVLKRVTQAGPTPWYGSPVDVVYTAGVATVPPDVKLAVLLYAGAMWMDTQQGYDIDELNPSAGPNLAAAQGQIVDLLSGQQR